MILIFLTPLAEIIWQIAINYPPTLEQINIGITSPYTLWVFRILSFALLVLSVYLFSKTLTDKAKKYFWFIVFLSPTLSLLWMSYPLDIVVIFAVSLSYYFFQKKTFSPLVITTLSVLLVLFAHLVVFKQNPKIIETLSLKRAQEEVTFRFTREDSLNPHIEIPTVLRRIGYNKYFLVLKNASNEMLTFFDIETLFFQEVHPLIQKSLVIFFWPQIFIFIVGLWLISNNKIKKTKSIFILLIIAFVYFLTKSASTERRLTLTIVPLAILFSETLSTAISHKNKGLRLTALTLICLTVYGWGTNYIDRFVRPMHWLDNRPTAYQFFLSYLKTNGHSQYSQVIVPDTLFAAKTYCPYYLSDCTKLTFQNFNLTKDKPQDGTLYVGFIGNFLGEKPENLFGSDYKKTLSQQGLEILDETRMWDNIAHGFGQELLIVRKSR